MYFKQSILNTLTEEYLNQYFKYFYKSILYSILSTTARLKYFPKSLSLFIKQLQRRILGLNGIRSQILQLKSQVE